MISQRTRAALQRTKARIAEQGFHVTPDGRTITKPVNSNVNESGPIPWSFAPQEQRDTPLT